MAVTIDDVSENQQSGSTTLTIAHVAGTGSDRLMVVGHGNTSSGGRAIPSSVVFNGSDSLTEKANQNLFSGDGYNGIWYTTANSQASGNLVVTCSTDQDELAGGVITLFGVDQTTPLDTQVTATGTGTAISVTVTSATDDLVIDQSYQLSDASGHTLTIGANQTQIAKQLFAAYIGDGMSYEAGGASIPMTWTAGESVSWGSMGVNVNAAAGGGGGLGIPIAAYHYNHNVGSKL